MFDFMKYTEIPIIVYYGDNLPETDERPELYEWTRRLHLMRKWAKMLNDLGGDVTVIHLPEIGLYGNRTTPFRTLPSRQRPSADAGKLSSAEKAVVHGVIKPKQEQ